MDVYFDSVLPPTAKEPQSYTLDLWLPADYVNSLRGTQGPRNPQHLRHATHTLPAYLLVPKCVGGFVPLLMLSLPLLFNSHQPRSYLSFSPTSPITSTMKISLDMSCPIR